MLKHRPMQEIAPWMTLVTPDMVLNKDGSLLATYEFHGIDADSPNTNDVSAARDQLDQACRSFDSRITAWWRLRHRRTREYIGGTFPAASDARLDALNRENMASGRYFHNSHSLALAYTPENGIDKIFERMAYHMTEGGKNVAVAAFETAKDVLLARNAFAFDLERTEADAKRFESMLDAFTGGATKLGLSRLSMQEGLSALHQTANPTVPPRPVRFPVTLLDTHLTESEVTCGADKLYFESAHGKRYAAIVAVKEWMGFQEAALDALTQLDVELDVCILYRFLDTHKATGHIEKIRRFYKMASFNLWSIIKQMAAKEEAENDEGRKQLAAEAGDALRRLTAEGQQHGFVNISVIVYGDTEAECEDAVSEVVGTITNAGFGPIREKANLLPAWNSTLPGRWDKQRRLQFVETPAVSDIAPLRSVRPGPTRNNWLSNLSGRDTPPLTCLPTRHRTSQRVDMHQPGGNGHLLVLGPIGAGKSVFLNFLVTQAGRQGARRIRFDKDRSTRIPTLLAGGKFVDVTGRFQAATQTNPLSLLGHPSNHAYLADWLALAIEDEDFRCTPQQRTDLYQAVQILSRFPRERWTLSNLRTQLHTTLRERLQIWVNGGQYGHFFDHVEDAFEVSDDLSIEMGDLFTNFPRAAALFMDYAFYRISQSMGTRYTIIEVEEAGFFFTNPRFYARLETWIVTIRKLNGAIWMATQSLQQIARVADFEILKDNIANIIYLPNSQAVTSKDLYCDVFGLTLDQTKLIAEAVPNRDYYWTTRSQSRMLQTAFSKEMIAMLRSDGYAQDVLDRHYASGLPDWQERYVREVLARG
ncbi:VirB4 family type IV secretion system protein [Cupriavidus pinatubonensis]|uniref:VirB4 family type IV secretion system protein n=1 Tax=Cupriavidus pinatubonensis TaxID=248026 RepID=UPI00112A7B00|nr:VirB4 family type IV secretion system protein [Cupriavidus pinatubonensis]TPQ30482.1 conjugal transfer protein [Cupriavidus pinatubonensis]